MANNVGIDSVEFFSALDLLSKQRHINQARCCIPRSNPR